MIELKTSWNKEKMLQSGELTAWSTCALTLPYGNKLDWNKLKAFAEDKSNVLKWSFLSVIELKTLWEKEKMLSISIFSFTNYVFTTPFSGLLKVGIAW